MQAIAQEKTQETIPMIIENSTALPIMKKAHCSSSYLSPSSSLVPTDGSSVVGSVGAVVGAMTDMVAVGETSSQSATEGQSQSRATVIYNSMTSYIGIYRLSADDGAYPSNYGTEVDLT